MKKIKEWYKFIYKVINFIWVKETSTQAGRFNLIGGLASIAAAILIIIQGTIVFIGNFFLTLLNKNRLPELDPIWTVAMLFGTFAYFIVCVHLLIKEGESINKQD